MKFFRFKKEKDINPNEILFDHGETPTEKVFDGMLKLRVIIKNDIKIEIIKISKNFNKSYKKHQLEINSDVYSLFILSLLLKDKNIKDDFHQYFELHGNLNRDYLGQIYKKISLHYPKYYDGYNQFVESKNGLFFGGVLTELLINDNPDFIMPMGDIMTSPLLIAKFSDHLQKVIEDISSFSKEYNISVI